ncbi:MAG: hypothetical protein A3F33_03245 [Candidatus Woykebacteria bacterium RIFCSPHIGHO2_12_FULL_43_10]|uniref:Uncharacterized protein n=2 Tax=Candidatus Woykeibacteriota TaxID=1817899 RepID=A0A1G1WXC7_9BACT|nr:MAG: hypothetical protein A3F33_03245 [Candidatus Woykebacteria bacterium RIFCSPHIGHO2_12_FULL_43_10]OGY29929.1 MAG: hypothetical protein A3J50_01820 [Candidatus Woykebacteria bacterium RIFCSPHIGHO2_02_FULL_43_16b]OGY32221.1 MAG: hypothetical protein A3A61_01785 [Candidatus Woykebacteria bacterium RIFCSPLOWO2_01_FULL_43_14]
MRKILSFLVVAIFFLVFSQKALANNRSSDYFSHRGNKHFLHYTKRNLPFHFRSKTDSKLTQKDFIIIFISTFLSFGLVIFVEWARNPRISIVIADSIMIPPNSKKKLPGRKILKLKIKVLKGWRNYLPLPKNIHAFSKVKVAVNWKNKPEYQAKWDSAPEPYDYINDVPKLEMAPLSMQPENLMFGDEAEVGVAIKHDGDNHYFFFDSDYYVNSQQNVCDLKNAELKVTFKSSLTEKTEIFRLKNLNNKLVGFSIS